MTGTGVTPEFEVFFAEYKDSVLRAVMVSTGNFADAEDCCSEAFVRALQRWDVVSVHPCPQAWVMRTAINVHIDRVRQQRRHRLALHKVASTEEQPEPELPLDAELRRAISALPERQRQVLALRIVLGMSGPETARELGISVGSVSTHLGRAVSSLRHALATEPDPKHPDLVPRNRS
jgi:RNA polymerase sigma-70 factor (ECF subfamily)